MKNVDKIYSKFSIGAVFSMLLAAIKAPSRLRRLAALNRLTDYLSIASNCKLMQLHKEINLILEKSITWQSYDYGEGYFYQSSPELHITGFRNTSARYNDMNLAKWIKGKTVLDIGCNSGFLSLMCVKDAQSITGVEINPYLVEIANISAEFLNCTNTSFIADTFENFIPDKKYDVVCSFANHSTYDKNTSHTLAQYFDKIKRCFVDGGGYFYLNQPMRKMLYWMY